MRTSSIARIYSPLFLVPAFILFSMFFVFPNIAGLVLGFTDWSSYFPLSPTFNGLTNFIDMFESSIFITAVKNTFYFAFLTTVVKVVLGLLLAIVLNSGIKYKKIYRTLVFSPVVINPLIVALIFTAIYDPSNGLLNNFLRSIGLGIFEQSWLTDVKIAMNSISIMEIWMNIGTVVIIFLAGLQTVPKEFYEASTIDGASGVQQFFHVTIPLIFQSINICVVLCLVRGMAVFAQVYGLTNGGPADTTQVYGTFIFKSFSSGLYGYSAASSIVFTIVISIITFIVLRIFRKMEVEY